MQKLIRLPDKQLRQLETQHSRVKPVEVGSRVFGLFNKSVKKLIFASAVITKYEFLLALLQD